MAEASQIEITAFEWVPPFARGFVRDLRPRWACEEIGLPYTTRLISAVDRPRWYFSEQPWGQVPVLHDGEVTVFESGAVLLHIAEREGKLLALQGSERAQGLSWLFAAFNSVEPFVFEAANVLMFSKGQEWAELRKPGCLEMLNKRLDGLERGLGDAEWLAGDFSIADIAMATVLREVEDHGLLSGRAELAAYLERAIGRPAFTRALNAQFADFKQEQPQES